MKKGIALIGTLVLGLGILAASYYSSTDTVEIKVNDKERVVTRNGDQTESRYLVYTEGEVFENTDDLFKLKFNSSDVQNELKTDSTYIVEVIGWRIPVLSMHRNIINIK